MKNKLDTQKVKHSQSHFEIEANWAEPIFKYKPFINKSFNKTFWCTIIKERPWALVLHFYIQEVLNRAEILVLWLLNSILLKNSLKNAATNWIF